MPSTRLRLLDKKRKKTSFFHRPEKQKGEVVPLREKEVILLRMEDVIIIGAGAVGAFIARSLSRFQVSVLVIEKENDVGDVTSMANSAIAHSGYDPEPGTKKALFNVAGNRMFPQLCKELDVSFGQVGTLTVATENEQLAMLKDLLERAKLNGVPAELLSAEEVKKAEPNINPEVKGALLCPTGGIVNPFTLVAHAMENAMDNGVKLALGEEVTGIAKEGSLFHVTTNKNTYEAKVVVNAAGLHADDIARMIEPIEWKILRGKASTTSLTTTRPAS